MYFPEAFDAPSIEKIEAAYGADKRISLSELEATQFGCNVINAGRHILMGRVETDLAERLRERDFEVSELELSEFQRGGGSAKSMALRLSDLDVTHS
jgi:ornithine--oxo-acid transaminase